MRPRHAPGRAGRSHQPAEERASATRSPAAPRARRRARRGSRGATWCARRRARDPLRRDRDAARARRRRTRAEPSAPRERADARTRHLGRGRLRILRAPASATAARPSARAVETQIAIDATGQDTASREGHAQHEERASTGRRPRTRARRRAPRAGPSAGAGSSHPPEKTTGSRLSPAGWLDRGGRARARAERSWQPADAEPHAPGLAARGVSRAARPLRGGTRSRLHVRGAAASVAGHRDRRGRGARGRRSRGRATRSPRRASDCGPRRAGPDHGDTRRSPSAGRGSAFARELALSAARRAAVRATPASIGDPGSPRARGHAARSIGPISLHRFALADRRSRWASAVARRRRRVDGLERARRLGPGRRGRRRRDRDVFRRQRRRCSSRARGASSSARLRARSPAAAAGSVSAFGIAIGVTTGPAAPTPRPRSAARRRRGRSSSSLARARDPLLLARRGRRGAHARHLRRAGGDARRASPPRAHARASASSRSLVALGHAGHRRASRPSSRSRSSPRRAASSTPSPTPRAPRRSRGALRDRQGARRAARGRGPRRSVARAVDVAPYTHLHGRRRGLPPGAARRAPPCPPRHRHGASRGVPCASTCSRARGASRRSRPLLRWLEDRGALFATVVAGGRGAPTASSSFRPGTRSRAAHPRRGARRQALRRCVRRGLPGAQRARAPSRREQDLTDADRELDDELAASRHDRRSTPRATSSPRRGSRVRPRSASTPRPRAWPTTRSSDASEGRARRGLVARAGVDPVPYIARAHLAGPRKERPLVIVDGTSSREHDLERWTRRRPRRSRSPIAGSSSSSTAPRSRATCRSSSRARSPSADRLGAREAARHRGGAHRHVEPPRRAWSRTASSRPSSSRASRTRRQAHRARLRLERREDILSIVADRLAREGLRVRGGPIGIDDAAFARLVEYPFEGEDAELASTIVTRLVARAQATWCAWRTSTPSGSKLRGSRRGRAWDVGGRVSKVSLSGGTARGGRCGEREEGLAHVRLSRARSRSCRLCR